jgi:hypothetical protein
VDFNAQNIASGIYFYRIEAGEFQDAKKMILGKYLANTVKDTTGQ